MTSRKEHMDTILGSYLTDSKAFEDAINGVASDLRETMRNIAIASGALAAAALVLLSSDIATDHTLVLIGILTLMAESVLAFGWLLHVQTVAGERILKQRYETLRPASRILTSYHDFQSGRKDADTFDRELKEYIEGSNERARAHHNDDETEPKKRDYWDRIFVGVLLFGVIFLGLGMVQPYAHIIATPTPVQ